MFRYGRTNYVSKDCTRTSEGLTNIVRVTRLLLNLYDDAMRFLLLPMQALVSRTIFACNFVLLTSFYTISTAEKVMLITIVLTSLFNWTAFLYISSKVLKYTKS